MICQCERVSLGEIEDVLSRSVPINSIKAIKKRTRAGFGRCQGGFCQPIITMLLAQKKGIDVTKVAYGKKDSYIVDHKVTKGEN